jgi:hypothetical protein
MREAAAAVMGVGAEGLEALDDFDISVPFR